jgi:branched-chain amino acid transport system substrate-binding protein
MMRGTFRRGREPSRFPELPGGDRMERLFRLSAVLAALVLILAACSSNNAGSSSGASVAASQDPAAVCNADPAGCVKINKDDPVKIASANTISGDTAFLGNDINFGIQVAINDKKTVDGHQIQLVKQDAGCGNAQDGQTAAQAIVADPQIVAVVGTSCSRTAVPAMPVLSKAGYLMISASNTAPSLTDPSSPDFGGKFYMRTAYNDKVQGAAVAKFACEVLKVKTAATIHDGSPYAKQLQQVFAEQFTSQCGGKITAQEAIQVGDKDFHTVLTTIGADKPDFLFYPIFDPEGPLITKQAQDVPNLAKTILAGADGIKDQGFIDAAGTIAEQRKMYFSGPDLNFGDKYTKDFLPKYYALAGQNSTLAPYHAHAYDAANIIFAAIEAVGLQGSDGTLYIPREALRAWARGIKNYPGLTGNLTCDPNGDCGSSFVSIAQLKPGASGKLTFQQVYTTRSAS